MGRGEPRRMSAASTSLAWDATAVPMRLTRKPTPVSAATATVNASSRTPSSPERHSRASVRRPKGRARSRLKPPPTAPAAPVIAFVSDNPTTLHDHNAVALSRKRPIVGDQHQRGVGLLVELEKQLYDAGACGRI